MSGEKRGACQGQGTGQRLLPAAALMLCLALVLSPITNMKAAELQILAGGAIAGPLRSSPRHSSVPPAIRWCFASGPPPN